MKIYNIHREGKLMTDPVKVIVMNVQEGEGGVSTGYELTPHKSLRVRNHSPDGFNFGYGGSGPAQLALAILMDYLGTVIPHPALYQSFKFKFIAPIKDEGGVITGEQIQEFINEFTGTRYIHPGDDS